MFNLIDDIIHAIGFFHSNEIGIKAKKANEDTYYFHAADCIKFDTKIKKANNPHI